MDWEKNIHWLDGGKVLAECGPMRLVIAAWLGQVPQRDTCIKAARASFTYLERIAKNRRLLSRPIPPGQIPPTDFLVEKMIRSTWLIEQEDLTPMAAVAGAIADVVADYLFNQGMTKVIVDNGGDLAIRLRPEETATVGIRPSLETGEIAHAIVLDGSRPTWGVATSGLGGRSLTRGVASAATVVAARSSVADAAATAVANAAFVEDDRIKQRPAEEIDAQTDIPGTPVTVAVGDIGEEKKRTALSRAMEKADELASRGLVKGAYVCIQDRSAMSDFIRLRLLDS